MSMASTAPFAATRGEILGIRNGLVGWREIGGLGPDYFASPEVETELLALVTTGQRVSPACRRALALGRARVVNFFGFIAEGSTPFARRSPCSFRHEVSVFLKQLKEQAEIWSKKRVFKSLNFDAAEREIYQRVMAKAAPVLFNMGFVDAIPHAGQVSRLAASIARSSGASDSEILQAAIAGFLHDPKLHPAIDLGRQNLATHPIVASALAEAILTDETLNGLLDSYFRGNQVLHQDFVLGCVDLLAINNDSKFVQMKFILPEFVKQVTSMFGGNVAAGFASVMEERIECISAGGQTAPPLPNHLWGCLSQIHFDSGLRGIRAVSWESAIGQCGIKSDNPQAVFTEIVDGKNCSVPSAQIYALRAALHAANPTAMFKAEINATTLLHHNLEVRLSGAAAAYALVCADSMMLSSFKVASVYQFAIIKRLQSYIESFDDNIRLLPPKAKMIGHLWQRAVYLSMLEAADLLTGATNISDFSSSHAAIAVDQQIDDLRALVLKPETWGRFADAQGTPANNADVAKALACLEQAYVTVVKQYRIAAYAGMDLGQFYPIAD